MHDRQMRSADQLAETLIRGSLVSPADLDRANERLAGGTDAQSLAEQLVGAGALTDYQAASLLRHDVTSLICGDYVLLDKLGQGSMGQVFKAMHRHLERIVALKVLTRFAAVSPETVERFQREAKAVAALDHPNIVRAYDARIDEPQSYLIMEFVDGVDLATLVDREGAIPVRLACQYVLQAARGLAHAHSKNIVHRDVKPSNLIVDSAGIVKVLDLGVARLQSCSRQDEPAHRRLTEEGQLLGTIAFMAPEQAEDSRFADARSDIYSLGCTLFYLLTKSLPYSGTTIFDTVEAHRNDSAPSLVSLCPNASEELQNLFEKAVAKDTAYRYASMNEFIEDLERCIKSGQGNASNNARPPQTARADSSRRWKSKQPRPSAETVPLRNGLGKPSSRSLPHGESAKSKRKVAARKKRMLLIAGLCPVITLLVILGIVALNHRQPSEAEASGAHTQSRSSKPAQTRPERDKSSISSSSKTQQESEDDSIVRSSLPPSTANEVPDERQSTTVNPAPPIDQKAPLDVPMPPKPKIRVASEDRATSDAPPELPVGKVAFDAGEPDASPADSHEFSLTLIIGKRQETLADVDSAAARLESYIEVRDRAEARRSESLPFVAAITIDNDMFELNSPDSALELCKALQSADSDDDIRTLVSRVAGDPVDVAGILRAVDEYVQQQFPRELDQWVKDKSRIPQQRDVRRIVMKIVARGKSTNKIPAYFDYRPTTLELDSLLGEILSRKSEQFKREALTRPPPHGHRPPPPPRRKPPPPR